MIRIITDSISDLSQQEGQAQGFSMGIDPMTLCCGIWCCGPALCRLCVPFGV